MSVIVVTGSSTGIGCGAAEMLAKSGHTVYATMRKPKYTPYLQQLAKAEKLSIKVLKMDVTDDKSVKEAFKTILKKEGHIDVLINNAGVASHGAVEELPLDLFDSDMDTNYFGTLRCIKAVLPSMREKQSGCIINVSSVAGKLYSNFHGAYCASKAAVEALSESLAQEVKPFNIHVALVEPGVIETPIFAKGNDIPANTHYNNIRRFLAFFEASLENHVQPVVVAEVIKEIAEGKRLAFRNTAGPDAAPLINYRASITDEEWINAGGVDDHTWATNVQKNMNLNVMKYLEGDVLPQDELSV